MTNYQECRLTEILDRMAEIIIDRPQLRRETDHERIAALGKLHYLIWEARKTLDLPDIEGLEPL